MYNIRKINRVVLIAGNTGENGKYEETGFLLDNKDELQRAKKHITDSVPSIAKHASESALKQVDEMFNENKEDKNVED